jgi:hypothetical protein
MFALVFRRYAPFAKFGFGFEGDNRGGPSLSVHATARTVGVVLFARGSVGSMTGTSSGTQFVGGGDFLRKLLGTPKSKVNCNLSRQHCGANSISFIASTAGANPMFRIRGIGNVAPDIDTFVDFSAEWVGSGVRFIGAVRGDDFPNAEVFVLDAKDQGCLLFDGRTTGGQDIGPMTRLAGAHELQRLGSFWCTMPLSSQGIFLHPKPSCSVTKMVAKERSAAWIGQGGQFTGGGASGRWGRG